MKDLKNKAIFITGAASGIGRAVALAFTGKGAGPLIISDIDEAGLAETLALLEARGCEAIALRLDVSDRAAVDGAVERAFEYAGRIDVLVNVAGVVGICPIEELETADWSRVLDVDLWGVINTVGAVYPSMTARCEGHIVNVASSSGLFDPVLYLAPYVVAKFGVVGFSEALLPEAAVHGIGVTCFCPGAVDTPIKDRIDLKGFTEGAGKVTRMALAVSQPVDKAAAILVRAVEKNTFMVVTTGFAKVLYFFRRHFPRTWFAYMRAFAKVFAHVFDRHRI